MDKQIKYNLTGIEIIEFALSDIKEDEFSKDQLTGQLGIAGDYDEKNEKVIVTIHVVIEKVYPKLKKPKKIGTLKVKYTYNVYGLEKIKDDDGGILPKSLVDIFNSISISTTRGILFTRFQATKLDNFILPLVDVSKIDVNYQDN